MKYIGIITFQNALNAGAVLQAYALQTVLTQLGHRVEFINYNSTKKLSWRNYIAKSPIAMFRKWHNIYYRRKYIRQGNFNKVLNLSSIVYFSYQDLLDKAIDYDVYIVGSDQIWNFYTSLSPVYMLDFVPANKKKIAYAASMGQCNMDKSLYLAFKNKLLNFDAISLREGNGVDFVNTLLAGEKRAFQTLDPTFLIDTKLYNGIIEKQASKGKYICSYVLSILDSEDLSIINYIKHYLELNIINIRNPDTCVWIRHTKNKIVNPYQWLSYIKNSEFVICSSFHAVVFSILFHKPFVALVPFAYKNKGGNMRINTILKDLNLLHRIIYHYDKNKLTDIMKETIDWDNIDKKIKYLRNLSIEFLKNNLK